MSCPPHSSRLGRQTSRARGSGHGDRGGHVLRGLLNGAAELGCAPEERGFESPWAPEHSYIPLSRTSPFPQGGDRPKQYDDVMDPFVSLTAAAVTTALKVDAGLCLVVQRDPIQTAKVVASLDQISDGASCSASARAGTPRMADHGTEFASRFALMRERVEETIP